MDTPTATPTEVKVIPINQLKPNPWNRTVFDPDALKELTASIKAEGVRDKLKVRRIKEGDYQIVSGHRRWLAAQAAGLKEVPCVVESMSDADVAEDNITMNIQREDIPPLELARMVKTYMDTFKKTQEQTARIFGKTQSWVSELVGFLKIRIEINKNIGAPIFSWHQLRALGQLNPEALHQINKELTEGRLKPAGIEKRCDQLSSGSTKAKTGQTAGQKVSQYLKEEGYKFVREGDSIVISARLPWGPALDLDSEMVKLRASLLLWISREQQNGIRDGGFGMREEENGPMKKAPLSSSHPSPAPRTPNPAPAGITRAPSWPAGQFDPSTTIPSESDEKEPSAEEQIRMAEEIIKKYGRIG